LSDSSGKGEAWRVAIEITILKETHMATLWEEINTYSNHNVLASIN
jgi:hypothetical protein